MNEWGSDRIPFIFIIDFDAISPVILRLEEADPERILYNINGITNVNGIREVTKEIILKKHPEPYQIYLQKFRKIKRELDLGNSYLLNLTCTTPVDINLSLSEIFYKSNARYRLWYNDQFVCFSPEIFVKIKDGIISSYPMKGTIDASVPDAAAIILNDEKETAEHYTIVDLIRNDLSMVSENVRVSRFRYIDRIITHERTLLQVSSEITGQVEDDYNCHLGDIIYSLLPAGSITGAPKKKTKEIIVKTEDYNRGYYSGIFGIFDGQSLDSGVMIRFIEKCNDSLFYKSGGGITSFSDPEKEYEEMINKIYVPVD